MRKFENKSKISSRKQGFLVILSAPSGCGKTTILTRLLKRHAEWVRSVSVTTRASRLGEKNRRDYEFVTLEAFQLLRRKKEFLEWAQVFGQYYGTRKSTVEEAVGKGETILLAVDVQGGRALRVALKEKIPYLSIFILPPSITALRERLDKRGTDSFDEIEKRIQRATEEIKAASEYEGTVINHDLDQTIHEIEGLISDFEGRLKKEGNSSGSNRG